MDWSDLRYALIVAREGTLAGAARVLGVNHSTVLRRVRVLEDALGVRLFERHARGYVTTPAGDELVAAAEGIERDAEEIARRLGGHDLRLSGTVRVTASDVTAVQLAAPLVAFRRQYPEIAVELDIRMEPRDIERGESDIAVRATKQPPEALVGRRLAEIAWGVYATPEYLRGRETPLGADAVDWVLLTSEVPGPTPFGEWQERWAPPARIAARMSAVMPAVAAIRAGLGVGAIPCAHADNVPDLVRLGEAFRVGMDLWLLTHADLRRVARVRVVMDWLTESIQSRSDVIEGARPLHPPLPALLPAPQAE